MTTSSKPADNIWSRQHYHSREKVNFGNDASLGSVVDVHSMMYALVEYERPEWKYILTADRSPGLSTKFDLSVRPPLSTTNFDLRALEYEVVVKVKQGV